MALQYVTYVGSRQKARNLAILSLWLVCEKQRQKETLLFFQAHNGKGRRLCWKCTVWDLQDDMNGCLGIVPANQKISAALTQLDAIRCFIMAQLSCPVHGCLYPPANQSIRACNISTIFRWADMSDQWSWGTVPPPPSFFLFVCVISQKVQSHHPAWFCLRELEPLICPLV